MSERAQLAFTAVAFAAAGIGCARAPLVDSVGCPTIPNLAYFRQADTLELSDEQLSAFRAKAEERVTCLRGIQREIEFVGDRDRSDTQEHRLSMVRHELSAAVDAVNVILTYQPDYNEREIRRPVLPEGESQ